MFINGTSFEAIDETTSIPPDPHNAVGPDHLVNVVNRSIEWYATTGNVAPVLENSQTLTSFFSANGLATNITTPFDPTLANGPNLNFDPKVIYDEFADRYVVVALSQSGRAADNDGDMVNDPLVVNTADDVSQINVAVSKTNDPNDGWWTGQINGLANDPESGSNLWADYPGFAVDEDAVYITLNMFSFDGIATDNITNVWIIDKGLGTGGFYDGTFTAPAAIDPQPSTDIEQATVQPAIVIGTPPGGTVGTYFVETSIANGGGTDNLLISRVDNPLTATSGDFTHFAAVSLGDIGNAVNGRNVNSPDAAPQLGWAGDGTDGLATNNSRALDAIYRDGILYTVFTVVPTSGPDAGQTTAWWAEIDVSGAAPVLLDHGGIGGEDIAAGTFTFFPSIAVNGDGDIGIGFSASSPTTYAGAYAAFHEVGAANGTVTNSFTVKEGEDFYLQTFGGTRNRWGDYTGIVVDPDDDHTFWAYNEFADNRIGTDSEWATAWASFLDPTLRTLTIEPIDAIKDEGDAGTTAFTFRVTRTGSTVDFTSVDYTVTGSGADPAEADDFAGNAFPTNTVTFADGQATATVTISVSGDTALEADESFTLTLSSPVNGVLGGTVSANGTIVNDDAELTIAALDAVKAEGDTGTTSFTFEVTRTGDLSDTSSATFTVTPSGADPAEALDFKDCVFPTGTVTFLAGETTKLITIEVVGDTVASGDEGFTVTLSDPVNAEIGTPGSADGLILNDDGPVPSKTVEIFAIDTDKAEGDFGMTPFTYEVRRFGDLSQAATIAWRVAEDSDADFFDFFNLTPSNTVDFQPGEFSEIITVWAQGDMDPEFDEPYTVELFAPSNVSIGENNLAKGVIRNDDAGSAGETDLRFILVDAATDLDVVELFDGDTIDRALLASGKFNIRAEVVGTEMDESLQFFIDGGFVRTENFEPYAVFSDNQVGDYRADNLGLGDYTLLTKMWDQNGGVGEFLYEETLNFTVVDGPAPDVRFFLIDADTDAEVGELTNGAVIDRGTLGDGKFSIEARVDNTSDDESIVFLLDGGFLRTENLDPYAAWGDDRFGDYRDDTLPATGEFDLTARVFDSNGGGGSLIVEETLEFSVI